MTFDQDDQMHDQHNDVQKLKYEKSFKFSRLIFYEPLEDKFNVSRKFPSAAHDILPFGILSASALGNCFL
jgi:hypothetical protein